MACVTEGELESSGTVNGCTNNLADTYNMSEKVAVAAGQRSHDTVSSRGVCRRLFGVSRAAGEFAFKTCWVLLEIFEQHIAGFTRHTAQ